MKPAPFEYLRAASLGSAIDLLAGFDGYAKYLAGGQTLGPMINLRLAQVDALIDLSRLPELRAVEDAGGAVRIGAGIRHAEIEDGLLPDAFQGLLPRAARTLAYRAVRNRGTLGGSLAHADPVAEWPGVLTALDAVIHIQGARGSRALPVVDFLVGALSTLLEPEEILTAIEIPKLSAGARVGFQKFCRKTGEFAESLAIAIVDGERTRVVLGSAAVKPARLTETETLVRSTPTWRERMETPVRHAVAADLARSGATYERYEADLHATMVARALKEALPA